MVFSVGLDFIRTFAASSCRYRSPFVRIKVQGGDRHNGKAFTLRFGFDDVRTSQLLND